MNLPNCLTVLRLIMTPFFLASLIYEFPQHYLIALIIFAAASITDMFDGQIARKRNLITDFGKFLDPLADKMLTTSAFLGFVFLKIGLGTVWIAFIVLIREFLITSLRLVSAGKGTVIAANVWGKAKTVSQMFAIIVTILGRYILSFSSANVLAVQVTVSVVTNSTLWISAALTVISGVIYVAENKKYINPEK